MVESKEDDRVNIIAYKSAYEKTPLGKRHRVVVVDYYYQGTRRKETFAYNDRYEKATVQENVSYFHNQITQRRKPVEAIEAGKITSSQNNKDSKRGGYLSTIRLSVVVRKGTNTPFYYPHQGDSTTDMKRAKASEKTMIKRLLGGDDYAVLTSWLKRRVKEKDIIITGGWSYQVWNNPRGTVGTYEKDSTALKNDRIIRWRKTEFTGQPGRKGVIVTDLLKSHRRGRPQGSGKATRTKVYDKDGNERYL